MEMDGKRVLIKTEKLTKRYEQATAVDGLDLEIYQGRSSASWVPTAPARPPPSSC